MKTFINKAFLAVVATVLVAGTAMFISCDKENQASLNSSHSDAKSENVSTNSLFEDHDYSISINGNGVNKTIYGKIGSEVKGAKEYIDGVLYEYSYIYSDEELYTLSKIGENTISLEDKNYIHTYQVTKNDFHESTNNISKGYVPNSILPLVSSTIILKTSNISDILYLLSI